MDGPKLKYDRVYDCWVLEPIRIHDSTRHRANQTYEGHRHSSAETFATSTPHSRFDATPQRRSFSLRYDNTRAWKSFTRYWTCLRAAKDSERYYSFNAKREKKLNVASCRNAIALRSCYSGMSNEEQDENLRAVVLYCKGVST